MQITKEKFKKIVGDTSIVHQCSEDTVGCTFFKIGDKVVCAVPTDQCLIIEECEDQEKAATYCMD